nr:immunoglobulin light chain junction region [Macaca mulatta]
WSSYEASDTFIF